MKIIIFIISLLYAASNFAQNTAIKTITINVKGNCEECKDRIENAVDIKGVKHAIWNEVNQILTITYLSNKITTNEIEKVIAAHEGVVQAKGGFRPRIDAKLSNTLVSSRKDCAIFRNFSTVK